MCKQWFQKRLEAIREGRVGPYSSTQWQKYLRYQKETKQFFGNSKNIARDFLMKECAIAKV